MKLYQRILILILLCSFAFLLYKYRNDVPRSNVQYTNLKINKDNCSGDAPDNIIALSKEDRFENNIPKVVHYVYSSTMIPSQYLPLAKNCIELNKDVRFIFWSDQSAHEFILKYFPEKKKLFESYLEKDAEPLKRSDIIRYFLLLKIGGIYMDLDYKCQKSFNLIMKDFSCVLSREPEAQTRILWDINYLVMNSFMACVPDHNFFKTMTESLTFMSKSIGVLSQTGPMFLTKIFENYLTNNTNHTMNNVTIFLAPTSLFPSNLEQALEWRCGVSKGIWRSKGCKELPEVRKINELEKKNAAIVHLFYHLGYPDRKHLIKTRTNICSSLPILIVPIFI